MDNPEQTITLTRLMDAIADVPGRSRYAGVVEANPREASENMMATANANRLPGIGSAP